MAHALVTGASGFIGYNLVKMLISRGDEVTCLVRTTSQLDHLQPLGVCLRYGDITDIDSLRGPIFDKSVVYHIAGVTSAKKQYWMNEQGTENVAHVCAEQTTPPVLVYLSSLAAAGPALEGRPRIEDDPPAPVSQYGRSKRAGELAAAAWADRVPISIVRPPIVLGKRDRVGLRIFRAIRRSRIHAIPRWRTPRFSVIDATDLSEMLLVVAQKGKRLRPKKEEEKEANGQGYYHIAYDANPTYAELGRMIATALKYRRVFCVHFGPIAVKVYALGCEFASHITHRPAYLSYDKTREIAAGNWTCSPEKAHRELGYAIGTPLIDRLRETTQWYRQEKWL